MEKKILEIGSMQKKKPNRKLNIAIIDQGLGFKKKVFRKPF